MRVLTQILFISLISLCSGSLHGQDVRVVDGGVPKAVIQVENAMHPVMSFAASELQGYIQKISGSAIPIDEELDLLLVISLQVDNTISITNDAFEIDIKPDRIELIGSNERSVLYAVYALLEKVGCMWVYPGEEGEVIPSLSTVALPIDKWSEQASIEHRGLALYELHHPTVDLGLEMIDWMAKNRFNLLMTSEDRIDNVGTQCIHWPEVKNVLYPAMQSRGILLELSEHMTHVYFPPSLGREHPEWFAMVNGQRHGRGQMCFSNQAAVDYFGDQVAKYVQEHPEADIIGTWPLDGGGYCECEGCLDSLAAFKAISQVAKKAASVNRKTTIEFLAYRDQTYSAPEGLVIPENLSVLMCDRLDDNARRWTELMEKNGARGQYYFEYVLGDNYRWRANVWLIPEYGPWLENQLVDLGFRGSVSLFLPIRNWWRSAFNNYFMSKACWNPEFDVEEALKVYCNAYYGDWSGSMLKILNIIRLNVQNTNLMASYHSEIIHPVSNDRSDIKDNGFQRSQDACAMVITRLDEIIPQVNDFVIQERMRRMKSYVEYFRIYYKERTLDGNPLPQKDNSVVPSELLNYSKQHPIDEDGVNMNPEFIKWRFERFHW